MQKARKLPSIERVKELVSYDPKTGIFIRNIQRGKHLPGLVAGTPRVGYVIVKIDQLQILGHRLAWFYVYGEWPEGVIDHINAIRSDNRIENLRVTSITENARNRLHGTRGGLLGARFDKRRGTWFATITRDGVTNWLGRHPTQLAAHMAYVAARDALQPGIAALIVARRYLHPERDCRVGAFPAVR